MRYLDLLFRAPMASWLDDLGLNELEHIKDGASAFAQELYPINSAEDFISFVVALNLYPPGTPLRAERIAGEMPAGLSAPAVRYLLKKLPIVDRLASQLRDDPSRKTVRLVPDVEHCVACGLAGEAVPLVVKWGSRCSHIGLSPPSRQPTKFQQSSLRLEVLECRNGGPAASPIWRLRRAAWARHPGRMRAAVSRDRWAPLGSPRAAELRWRNRNGCPSSAPAPGLPK